MSEQPERIEAWAVTDGKSISKLGREIDARATAKSLGDEYREVRLTERRDGETIVGPLEMAVIEAADNWLTKRDAVGGSMNIILNSNLIFAAERLEAAVRALREARRPKEPSNG